MESITADSSRKWIDKHPLKWRRYLRRCHKRPDRQTVFDLLFWLCPDEGKKLIRNFSLSDEDKKMLLLTWIILEPQITCGILGDQRQGKDALICEIFSAVISYCKEHGINVPRFVTLGNMRKPPFVEEKDMYFSFRHIPVGSAKQEVWVYSSEIEAVLPSREGKNPQNQLFSQLEGTFAQNHQKIFGCIKLTSKVDINFLRSMNCKLCKYIEPSKLEIEGVERLNVISDLAKWHLPKKKKKKAETLMVFDNQILSVDYGLPEWWSDEYSEQFRNVPLDKVKDYVIVMVGDGMKIPNVQIAVAQKFRVDLSKDNIAEMLE